MIKSLLLAAAICVAAVPALAASSHAVRGYTKKNGTYVEPTRATNPNNTKRDNYSRKGNVNPANGKQGTKQ